MINITIQGKIPSLDGFKFDTTFEKVAKYMEVSIKRNFSEGGRPETWMPLKKTGAPSHLYQNGAMFNDVQSNYGENFAEAGMLFHQQIWYWVHQYGSAKKNIPIRRYILFQEEDFSWILNEFKNDLVTFWNEKGVQIG